jgi:plastocyanin
MLIRHIPVLIGTLIVVVSTACNRPATAAAQPNPQSQVPTIDMTDAPYRYAPATLTVPRGTTVTWTTIGSDPHTVTDNPSKAVNPADASLPTGVQPWESGLVASGQSYSQTFTVPGTYNYFCIPHESLGMVATITVS